MPSIICQSKIPYIHVNVSPKSSVYFVSRSQNRRAIELLKRPPKRDTDFNPRHSLFTFEGTGSFGTRTDFCRNKMAMVLERQEPYIIGSDDRYKHKETVLGRNIKHAKPLLSLVQPLTLSLLPFAFALCFWIDSVNLPTRPSQTESPL